MNILENTVCVGKGGVGWYWLKKEKKEEFSRFPNSFSFVLFFFQNYLLRRGNELFNKINKFRFIILGVDVYEDNDIYK